MADVYCECMRGHVETRRCGRCETATEARAFARRPQCPDCGVRITADTAEGREDGLLCDACFTARLDKYH